MKQYLPIITVAILSACNSGTDKPDVDDSLNKLTTPVINYNIISVFPHDTSAYTQGLVVYNGKIYEGTGDYENSSLRITDIKTGKVEEKHMMGSDKVFGEGITILNDKLYQLTWQSNLVYVYDLKNIAKPVQTLNWPYEGWGITHNGTDLIISDGSANLYFVNPADLKVKTTKAVTGNSGNVTELNELEYVNGFIYANIYQSDIIVKIDPESGHIVGRMNLEGLQQQYFPNEYVPGRTDVLNGIAYDSSSKKTYITGKRWPKLFEISIN